LATGSGLVGLVLFTAGWKKDFNVYSQAETLAGLDLLFSGFSNVSGSRRGGIGFAGCVFESHGDGTMIGTHNLMLRLSL